MSLNELMDLAGAVMYDYSAEDDGTQADMVARCIELNGLSTEDANTLKSLLEAEGFLA